MPSLNSRADADLVQASRDGDRDAFAILVERYQNLVCSMAYSALGDLGRSEDVAQDAFLAAWQSLVRLRDPARFRAWLCGIARNLIRQSLRRFGREPTSGAATLDDVAPQAAQTPPPPEQVITDEEAGLLWQSLQRLPESYRVPMVLFYREHQSIEAVAGNLELSEDAVRQRLSRGRTLLEAEVFRFVESALTRTSPNRRFTRSVVAALPASAGATQLAATGAVAKGWLASAGWFAWLNAAVMIGASLLAWKTAIDDASTPRMRRTLVRLAWIPVAGLGLTLAVSWFWLPLLGGQPALLGLAVGVLLFGNGAVMVLVGERLRRSQNEVTPETLPAFLPSPLPTPALNATQATWKATRLLLPCLLLMGVGTWGLPWSRHPTRCLVVLTSELLLVGWALLHFRRQFLPPSQFPKPPLGTSTSRSPTLEKLRPLGVPLVLGGSALMAALIVLFLAPVGSLLQPGIAARLGWIGLGVLGGVIGLGILAHFITRPAPGTESTKAAIDRVYAPFFAESARDRRLAASLKIQLLRRTMASTHATLAWWRGRPDPEPHLEEVRRCDEQIRLLLGADLHGAFRRFERTLPDRERLERFRRQCPGAEAQISTEQEDRLVSELAEARSLRTWSQPLSRRESITSDLTSAFSAEALDLHEREEADFIDTFQPRLDSLLGTRWASEYRRFIVGDLRSRLSEWRRLRPPTPLEGDLSSHRKIEA